MEVQKNYEMETTPSINEIKELGSKMNWAELWNKIKWGRENFKEKTQKEQKKEDLSPEKISSAQLQACCAEWDKWINIERNNKVTNEYLARRWCIPAGQFT
jgi:hypothetical protein